MLADYPELSGRVVVHLDLGDEFRGGQRQVLYLAEAQQAAGMAVLMAAPTGSPILREAGKRNLPLLGLPGTRDIDPRNFATLHRMLQPGDIVHTHEARAASLGALLAKGTRSVCLVHTRRVSYPLGRGWSGLKYRLADLVVCVGREVEEAVHQGGVRRTVVIPSSITLTRYRHSRLDNGGRLGIIGALSPQKGHRQFFEALALLNERPEVWIIGAGALEEELRMLAARLGLVDCLVWKGEIESPDVLPQLDALVVPSVHGEGSSGVLKEGWAAGVPVICSDLSANRELVRHEHNGLVFANGDAGSLARQLLRLHAEPDLVAILVRNGLDEVAAHDVAHMHGRYLAAYVRALRSPK